MSKPTQEMIEAGKAVVNGWDLLTRPLDDLVIEVYQAMEAARPKRTQLQEAMEKSDET